MSGFEKYSKIFINRASEVIHEQDFKTKFPEVFTNKLLGLSGPKQLITKETPSNIFFSKLFHGFQEIFDSYHCLLDIAIYIGRFPYGNTPISKTRHLAYHMENYLNEVYILKMRLNSYFTILGRLYRKDRRHQEILKRTKALFSFVNNALTGIIDTRGSHIHKTRFNDEDIDQLSYQEFFSVHGGDEFQIITNLFKTDYRKVKKKYKVTVQNNNEQIKKILDGCFDMLYEIVVDKNGQIKYPELEKT